MYNATFVHFLKHSLSVKLSTKTRQIVESIELAKKAMAFKGDHIEPTLFKKAFFTSDQVWMNEYFKQIPLTLQHMKSESFTQTTAAAKFFCLHVSINSNP